MLTVIYYLDLDFGSKEKKKHYTLNTKILQSPS